MKKILSIANTLLLMLFRGGTAWGVIFLAAICSAFIFFCAKSDDILINELQIRVRYSLYFLTGLLSFALLYIACTSLTKDIEGRQFHMISAAPVHRSQIWLGKYLGFITFGIITFICGSLSVAICSASFIATWNKPAEKELLKEKFFRSYYVCEPISSSSEELGKKVLEEFKRIQREAEEKNPKIKSGDKQYHEDSPEWIQKKYLLNAIRRKLQMMPHGTSKQWDFNLDVNQAYGDFLLLRFKFYAEKKREKISGTWIWDSPGEKEVWSHDFSGFPYIPYEIKIPIENVADSKIFRLTFKGKDTPYLIFPLDNGVQLLYDSGGILKNYIHLLVITSLHVAILAAFALAVASFFTYTVSVFVTLTSYMIVLISDSFINLIRYHYYGEEGFLSKIISLVIWLTKGIKTPPVHEMFSEGISIPLLKIFEDCGVGFIIYMVLIIATGIHVLKRKEIDRILQS